MGIFKKTETEKAERQQKVDEINQKKQEKLAEVQDKSEKKAREKAALSGFNVTEAIYVFSCLPNDDEKGLLICPLEQYFQTEWRSFKSVGLEM